MITNRLISIGSGNGPWFSRVTSEGPGRNTHVQR